MNKLVLFAVSIFLLVMALAYSSIYPKDNQIFTCELKILPVPKEGKSHVKPYRYLYPVR